MELRVDLELVESRMIRLQNDARDVCMSTRKVMVQLVWRKVDENHQGW